jgi:fumarate reductase flavoprotein subunit
VKSAAEEVAAGLPGQAGEQPFDTVVVGCGLAGSVAALRAQQLGCRTLLVDKAPDGTAAGNTRLSGGALHAAGVHLDEDAARIAARIDTVTEGQADPRLRDAFAATAGRALLWLLDCEVGFERRDPRNGFLMLAPWRDLGDLDAWPNRGPQQALTTLQRRFRGQGGVIACGGGVDRLLGSPADGVGGAILAYRCRTYPVRAASTILCDGGFQANDVLLDRFIGPRASRIKLRASPSGQGDALRMASAFGAATTKMRYFYGHLLHRDALHDDRLWPFPTLDSLLPGAAVITRAGRRLLDEGRGGIAVANTLAGSENPTGSWLVLDAEAWELARHADRERRSELNASTPVLSIEERHGRFAQAESLAQLGAAMGVDATNLISEIDDLNAAVAAGRGDSLPVPRTQARQQIRSAPFRAIPLTPGITFTMGGLRIDDRARVLDYRERAIPGLLAAGGSAGGLQGCDSGGYVGGLSPALVFGLLAGEQAAAAAGRPPCCRYCARPREGLPRDFHSGPGRPV